MQDCSKKFCSDKKKLLVRMNRIEGQVRGVKRMIEEEEYCDDILHQIASVKAALDGVSKVILENHLKKCVVMGIKNNEENRVIDELIRTLGKMIK